LLEEFLEVKDSSIPNSGKGLFTKIFIPKGTLIVEYKGRRTTWKEVEDDYKNGYIYFISSSKVIDAKSYKKALGRYANDAKGLSRIKSIGNNSVYEVDGDKVFIKAVKDIAAGSEILVDYGKDYWEITKKNFAD
jgi:SET domain-containing protein